MLFVPPGKLWSSSRSFRCSRQRSIGRRHVIVNDAADAGCGRTFAYTSAFAGRDRSFPRGVRRHTIGFTQQEEVMANPEHVEILKRGVDDWNRWREQNPTVQPLLNSAPLVHAHLENFNLSRANLHSAALVEADLRRAVLTNADLRSANLSWARLTDADLASADLNYAQAVGTHLGRCNLLSAELRGANFMGADLVSAVFNLASLGGTILAQANLSDASGLEHCEHHGPSVLDHGTFLRSGILPLPFLRGCGIPERLIEYLPSLLNRPIEFYSCFISYSTKDQAFADRLYADLQANGVRCWFAPHDIQGGKKVHEQIHCCPAITRTDSTG